MLIIEPENLLRPSPGIFCFKLSYADKSYRLGSQPEQKKKLPAAEQILQQEVFASLYVYKRQYLCKDLSCPR